MLVDFLVFGTFWHLRWFLLFCGKFWCFGWFTGLVFAVSFVLATFVSFRCFDSFWYFVGSVFVRVGGLSV